MLTLLLFPPGSEMLGILTTLRSSTLLSTFLEALTRGTPSSANPTAKPRPIEMHAHDSERYVGDMLGWVHQAVASEREFLEGLFGVEEEGRMVGSTRRNMGSLTVGGEGLDERGLLGQRQRERVEKERLVREVLDRCLEGCCRPLRVSFFSPSALYS